MLFGVTLDYCFENKFFPIQQGNNITDGMTNVGQLPSSGQNEPSPPVSPLPLLLPGEVVKFSGKYSTSSTTITTNTTNVTAAVAQVKNSIKDEVVIRNADSGKGTMKGIIYIDSLMLLI